MANSIFSKLFSKTDKKTAFIYKTSGTKLEFLTTQEILKSIKNAQATEFIMAQYVCLKMLEEQGEAESTLDGFSVECEVITRLDDNTKELLQLPPIWESSIIAEFEGTTKSKNFTAKLYAETIHGTKTISYTIDGAFIKFGEENKFLLTKEQFQIFKEYEIHKNSAKSEYDNLFFITCLQEMKKRGCKISLAHFDKINVLTPESITIRAELDEEGNLVLTPYMMQKASNESTSNCLVQLQDKETKTIKIGNETILLSEKNINAISEVIRYKKIPKEMVQYFLENPTAFLDANLVDLENGFSIRVHGATIFKPAYFGQKDIYNIDWFTYYGEDEFLPIIAIKKYIQNENQLEEAKGNYKTACTVGATVMMFKEKTFDISDRDLVDKIFKSIEEEGFDGCGTGEDTEVDGDDAIITVDIDLNDTELSTKDPFIEEEIEDVLYKGELDWSNYKYTPFSYQEKGIRWVLGLNEKSKINNNPSGALLADDMGLGKTFMALSTIEHIYQDIEKSSGVKKPVLVVAPLSLLENWEDEIYKVFTKSPFSSIVLLQSGRDLKDFRCGSAETKFVITEEDNTKGLTPVYSLKVGNNFGNERLDKEGRIVLTTYQTLRDYQFSLSSVNWQMVIFDEAQNIKNPNALQTRAAKAIHADFSLLMTGTPVENSLAEFWTIMDTACPSLLNTYQEFRKTYMHPIAKATSDEIELTKHNIGRKLRKDVGAYMLRRVKEDELEGIPNKTLYSGQEFAGWHHLDELESTMQDKQLAKYDDNLFKYATSKNNASLTILRNLRNISLHPILTENNKIDYPKNEKEARLLFNGSGKLDSLVLILDKIKERKEKVIIFAINKNLQSILSVSLGKIYNLGLISVINGDTKAVSKRAHYENIEQDADKKTILTRKEIIKDFESEAGFNIIIMSPIAAGVGLTVVGANNVIHLERHWNPAKEAQATDRVYRIGQEKDVNVYVPILHHPRQESFDVNLHKLLAKKTSLKDAVIAVGDVLPDLGFSAFPDDLDKKISFMDIPMLSWEKFEALSLEVLAREYQATDSFLTNAGGDHGADGVIFTKKENILIQVKYTSNVIKDYRAVDEVLLAKPIYEKHLDRTFNKLIFITNSLKIDEYDKSKNKVIPENVQIILGAELEKLLNKHKITFRNILQRFQYERLSI